MGGKQQSRQKKVAIAAGAALGTLVAAKLVLTLLRGKDRDVCKDIKFRPILSPSDIFRLVDQVIANSIRVHDSVAAVPLDKVTYESVIEPLARLEAEEFMSVQSCVFPSLVATSKDVRDASIRAEKMFETYNAKCRLREDVYRVVKAYANKQEELRPEKQRFLNHLVRDYERLGLHLNAQGRSEVERIKKAIGELCVTFQRNLAQQNGFLLFSEEELAGLPTTAIKNLEKGKHGKLKVPLDARHYFPVMQNCKVGTTRKALATAYDRRCMAENVPILHSVVMLRHRLARLLGYPNHVEYVTSIRMARSFSNVKNFLLSLSAKMSSIAAEELNRLRALKRAEEGEGEFGMEDLLYYMHRAEELDYHASTEIFKEYFPVEVVTNGVLGIYQELLGLIFEEKENFDAWHPQVRLFAVNDAESKKRLGYFYLDIYHRNGKYSHACVCPLQPACTLDNRLPVAAMLAKFAKASSTLLSFSEVETFFHEFGHVMHHLCSCPSYARFSGLRVEDDFVEAPSKMLEKWCSYKTTLKQMSRSYKDNREAVPGRVLEMVVRRKKSHAGLLTKRQILLALFDLIIHSSDQFDSIAILEQLHFQVMEGISMLDGTDLSASFSHLMGGYDGTYYSYLWNQVLSEDMFETGFTGDVGNLAAGREFRDKVLTPGATKDASDIVHSFLGREPSLSAFGCKPSRVCDCAGGSCCESINRQSDFMVASSSSLPPPRWPPGFRFRPTDQELVGFYLTRKVSGRHIQSGIIAEVDLYKCEPWDLPDKSSLGNDVEWYFFSPRDKKYPNGSRTNRATEAGYWKATGKDRVVRVGSRGIGMKKTLVFYKGRAPHGQRTDWIMHEYRLDEGDGQHFQDTFVLCRVFRKSTPKNEEEAIPSYLDEDFTYSAIVVPDEKEATEPDGGQICSPENRLPVLVEEPPTVQVGDDPLDAFLMMLLEEPTEESQMLPFAEDKTGAGFFDTDADLLEQIQHCVEPQSSGVMIQVPGAGDITDVLSGDFIELDDLMNPTALTSSPVANTAVVPSENKLNWMDALVQDGHSVYIMENDMTSAPAAGDARELSGPVLEKEGGGGPVKRFLSMLGGSVHVLPASAAEYPERQKLLNVHVTVTYERPLVKKRDKQQHFSGNLLFVFLVGSLSALFWILLWPAMSKLASYMHAVVLL